MRLAAPLPVVQVVLLTLGGAIGEGGCAAIIAGATSRNVPDAQTTGALVGGAAGLPSTTSDFAIEEPVVGVPASIDAP